MTSPAMIAVETVLQVSLTADAAGLAQPLLRQRHRVMAGITIRQLLQAIGARELADRIDSGRLGLSVFGKRAWLDDVLLDGSRVEVLAPIEADAKAARVVRAAGDRSRRRGRVSSVR